jgi:hypothetical protein
VWREGRRKLLRIRWEKNKIKKQIKQDNNEGNCKSKVAPCVSALCHEDIWGSGDIAPPFLDFGTRWW